MEHDMTTGSPAKHLLFFAIPVFLGSLFQQLYTMVDTMIVGRFIDVKALAAVGATGSISFLTIGFVLGITTGFGIQVSQCFGAKDMDTLKKSIGSSFLLGAILLILMTVLVSLGLGPLLHLLDTPANIYHDAYQYMLIYTLGLIGPMAYNLVAAILRALGDSKTPLYFLIFSSILNIVLDLTFIIVFHWGVSGASFATVLSQFISAILCFRYARKKYEIMHVTKDYFSFEPQLWKKMMEMGLPMALQYCVTSVGAMILQTKTNSFGYVAVAAFTAANKLESLSVQPFSSLGSAIATYTGQNLGANKWDRIGQGAKVGFFYTLAISLILGIFMRIAGLSIVKMFLPSGTSDVVPQILEYAHMYITLMILFYIPLGMIFLYRSGLQGMGNGIVPFLGGVVELFGRSIAAIFLTGPFKFWGIAAAGPLAWVTSSIPLCIIFYMQLRKNKQKFQ